MIDFILSLLTLAILWPILLVITIWLHFANKGAGAFFLQERPGKNGKIFKVVKFKTMTDERDAVLQAVYLILNVERYAFPIYSRNYGSELSDLIGKPKDYAMSEIKRRITEALLQDDRITSLDGWTFETGRNWVLARFTVHTIYGDVSAQKEVDI